MKILTNIWVLGTLVLIAVAVPAVYEFASYEVPPPPETMYDKEVDGRAVAALWNTQTGHVEKLTSELERRSRDLDARSAELDQMEERLKNEREELRRLQDDVIAQQQALDDMILRIENSEVKNLRSQATVYSNMDAENTVRVFETMNEIDVAKILYFMGPDVQSEIFASMIELYPAPSDEDLAAGGLRAVNRPNGPKMVARLNDLLKFTQPPETKKSAGGF